MRLRSARRTLPFRDRQGSDAAACAEGTTGRGEETWEAVAPAFCSADRRRGHAGSRI